MRRRALVDNKNERVKTKVLSLLLAFISLSILLLSSLKVSADNVQKSPDSTKSKVVFGQTKAPNILWLVVEDMSPILSMYGDNTVQTPAIESLAKEGVVYTNVYSTSGVCSPSRAALALGMYPSAIGANHMRTTSNTKETGLPKYEAVPPSEAKMLSQLLREHGYYTTNNLKTDYQFRHPKAAWNESGPYAHWRNRSEGQAFFAVVNFTTTHESGLFEPYGIRKIESRHYFSDDEKRIENLPQHHSIKTSEAETPIHVALNSDFPIPPYLPDTPVVRRDMWKMYNNLVETDKQIESVLQQLKDDGLYDETIIMFYADHGGPLPRQKRLIYDSGLKVPLIVRFPKGLKAGSSDDQLISFIDFAPSTLALVGASIPRNIHGKNFFDDVTAVKDGKRQFIHAAADRFDGFTDTIRAVKDARFKYIKNYRPQQPYYLPVAYREKIPTMQELLRLHASDELDLIQQQWFRQTKEPEELFDTVNDPHELNNLAGLAQYQSKLEELRNENNRWLNAIADAPEQRERDLIKKLWQHADVQPETAKPIASYHLGKLRLSSDTEGAVISYRKLNQLENPREWNLYNEPFPVSQGDKLEVYAHRIGYTQSSKFTLVVN